MTRISIKRKLSEEIIANNWTRLFFTHLVERHVTALQKSNQRIEKNCFFRWFYFFSHEKERRRKKSKWNSQIAIRSAHWSMGQRMNKRESIKQRVQILWFTDLAEKIEKLPQKKFFVFKARFCWRLQLACMFCPK